jgi:hypothetical protein
VFGGFFFINIRLLEVFNVVFVGERALGLIVDFFREVVRSISVDWRWNERCDFILSGKNSIFILIMIESAHDADFGTEAHTVALL